MLSQNRSSLRKRIFYIFGRTGLFYFLFFSKSIVYNYFMSSVIDLSLEVNLLFEKILLDLTEEAKL